MNEHLFYDLKQASYLTPNLSRQVAREIGRRIVAGSYAEGALIEGEAALAGRYRVSRSVIRDAVKILAGKGLLDVRRGIGTMVRPRGQWGLLDDDVLAWHLSTPVNLDMLHELVEIRQVFEPQAARWAAERGSGEAHARIGEALRQMEAGIDSVEGFVIADATFHRCIIRATGNKFLGALEGVVFSYLLSSIRTTNTGPNDNESSIPYHRAVCNAIIRRNGPRAERSMRRLLENAGERLGKRRMKNSSKPRKRGQRDAA